MKQKFIVYIDCNPTVSYDNLARCLQNILEDNLGGIWFDPDTVKVNVRNTLKKKQRNRRKNVASAAKRR